MEVPGRRFVSRGCDEDRQSTVHCEPCEENNIEQLATGYCVDCNEFICSGCQQTHRGSKISRHHNILDNTNMPTHKLSSTDGNFCPKHDGKLLEYYCRTHMVFICGVCVTLDHRQCVSVDFIKDAAAGFVKSQEYQELLTKIENIKEKLSEFLNRSQYAIDENSLRFEVIISDIKTFREEINTVLDTLEKKIITDAEHLREENITNVKAVKVQYQSTLSEIEAMKTDMENSIKYKQDQQLLTTAKKAKTQINCIENEFNDFSGKTIKLKRFQPDKKLLKALKSYVSLGTLEDVNEEYMSKMVGRNDNQDNIFEKDIEATGKTTQKADVCKPSAKNENKNHSSLNFKEPHKWKASFQGEIRINVKQDKGKSYITSGVELADGSFLLVDNNNSCLKTVGSDQKTVRLLIQLPYKPWDITLYRHDQYVLSTEGKLSFVNIHQVASLDRELLVEGDLKGIAYHDDEFIVSCAAPNPRVKIIDNDGRVLKIFQHDKNGWDLFVNPWYLIINPIQNTIIVSDFENHAVIGLDMEGNVTGKYNDRNLKGPTGLAVDPCGVVFLTGRKSHNVHMISGTCTQLQLLLHRRDGEELPQCPIVRRNKDKLFISHNWRTRMSNTLSVYKLE